MGCKIHLVPLNAGGVPNGQWFLTDAPNGFDGTLSISCDNITFVPIINLPSHSIPLDNTCPNKHDIWIDMEGEEPGTYIFTFVSPLSNTAEECGDLCVDCQVFVVNAEEITASSGEGVYCETDCSQYNVFNLLGISSSDYNIVSVTNCTLGNANCVAQSGNFEPCNLGAGEFLVTLVREGASPDCDSCTVEFNIIVEEAGNAGEPQELLICL
jgi:hypothetical protein